MEYRLLGKSGLRVPVLSFGTATFGGTDDFFSKWGNTDVQHAKRLVDISLEHDLNFFDTANVYSGGASETILGAALKGRRSQALISTKGTFSMGNGPNDKGASRYHIIRECEASLQRLDTDYIDVYFIHGFDPFTPMEETLYALNELIQSGKVRYIGCSNFAAWQLMKALSISEKHKLNQYVIYQGYYSAIGRDYESELMPLIEDQQLGLMVWSPLGWGRLTGKIKRGKPIQNGRISVGGSTGGPEISDEFLFNVTDVLEQISEETGKSIPQIAINWLLQRKTVSNIIMGARNEDQLIHNLGSLGWDLTSDQIERIETVSSERPLYPHWVGMR